MTHAPLRSFRLGVGLGLATLALSCDGPRGPSTPEAVPAPRRALPPTATPVPPARPVESLAKLEAAGRSPLELTAAPVDGNPPLPTYRARVRNVSNRPVRRVVATVVYLDAKGRPLPGENHDVAFGSPLKAIDPGATIETSFLSRVDRATEVRLVVREVTFLENGPRGTGVAREWKSRRYEADLAAAEGQR